LTRVEPKRDRFKAKEGQVQMPRVARVVVPGLPHHVTHRGNRRQPIFFSDADRERYLDLMRGAASKYELDLWAYCLMTNHVHLLAIPARPDSLARTVGYAHRMYSCHVNSRHGWTGHLWANRFYSAPVDPEKSWVVARYIELNPVRAGLVTRAQDHSWSSARAHCLGAHDPMLATGRPWPEDRDEWKRWLGQKVDESEDRAIRRATATGSPFGSSSFVQELEKSLGRRLRRRRYGSAKHGAGVDLPETD